MYEKKCPSCGKKMIYKRKNALTYSLKNNCLCCSCANKRTVNRILNDPVKSKKYKQKLSKSLKGRKILWNDKISKTMLGRKVSNEVKGKISKSVSGSKNPFYGKKHSDKTKRKIRLARIKYLNEIHNGGVCPTYNPTACRIIDEYGKKYGYNFKHAENGGEHYIKGLGYWVDGYDEQKNVVIEYYEVYHKYPKAKKRDLVRKNEIINRLNCKFIEIREWEQKK